MRNPCKTEWEIYKKKLLRNPFKLGEQPMPDWVRNPAKLNKKSMPNQSRPDLGCQITGNCSETSEQLSRPACSVSLCSRKCDLWQNISPHSSHASCLLFRQPLPLCRVLVQLLYQGWQTTCNTNLWKQLLKKSTKHIFDKSLEKMLQCPCYNLCVAAQLIIIRHDKICRHKVKIDKTASDSQDSAQTHDSLTVTKI